MVPPRNNFVGYASQISKLIYSACFVNIMRQETRPLVSTSVICCRPRHQQSHTKANVAYQHVLLQYRYSCLTFIDLIVFKAFRVYSYKNLNSTLNEPSCSFCLFFQCYKFNKYLQYRYTTEIPVARLALDIVPQLLQPLFVSRNSTTAVFKNKRQAVKIMCTLHAPE